VGNVLREAHFLTSSLALRISAVSLVLQPRLRLEFPSVISELSRATFRAIAGVSQNLVKRKPVLFPLATTAPAKIGSHYSSARDFFTTII
jgi:hypothetical protein